MAGWTGFGGSWNDGVHSGGDDSGSIGGGGIKLDGHGNPVGTRSPNASDIAAQYNNFGGTQITSSQVSNIRGDGLGGYSADISGSNHTVATGSDAPKTTTVGGFTGIANSGNNGKGKNEPAGSVSDWNEATNLVRAGTIPTNFTLKDEKVGAMVPVYKTFHSGHGDTYDKKVGEQFMEIPALTAAYNEGLTERNSMRDAIKFSSNFFQELTSKYGDKASQLATELADAAKGKQIRNVEEALAAFDKYKNSLGSKFNAVDRAAIANALRSLDQAEMARNLAKFSKAFGITNIAFDVGDIAFAMAEAYETENWRPVALKLEALAVGKVATQVVATVFAAIIGVPLGIVGFAIVMALTSAFIDDTLVDQINRRLEIY